MAFGFRPTCRRRVVPQTVEVWKGVTNFGQNEVWPSCFTKFGQHQLWPNQLWPATTLAKRMTNFGQTRFGQTKFGQHHILVLKVGWEAGSGGRWSGSGPRRGKASKGEGPEPRNMRPKGQPEGWEAQNVALFFPLPPQFSFCLPSLGGLLVEFWWCLRRRGLKCASLGFRVKTRLQEPPLVADHEPLAVHCQPVMHDEASLVLDDPFLGSSSKPHSDPGSCQRHYRNCTNKTHQNEPHPAPQQQGSRTGLSPNGLSPISNNPEIPVPTLFPLGLSVWIWSTPRNLRKVRARITGLAILFAS